MGKTIAEVYDEVVASAELQEEYLAAEQEGEEAVVAFAAAHGCEATTEEIEVFLQEKLDEDGEISLDDLDQVAGGTATQGKDKKPQAKKVQYKNIDININGEKVNCLIDGKDVIGKPPAGQTC